MLAQDIRNGFVYWAKLGPRRALIRIMYHKLRDVTMYGKSGLKTPIRTVYRAYDYSLRREFNFFTGRSLQSVVKPRFVIDDLPVYDKSENGIPVEFHGDTKFVNCKENYGNILTHCANN